MAMPMAKLTAGDPVKNAKALLRYSLPIENKPIRQVQGELEGLSEALRIPNLKQKIGGVKKVRIVVMLRDLQSSRIAELSCYAEMTVA